MGDIIKPIRILSIDFDYFQECNTDLDVDLMDKILHCGNDKSVELNKNVQMRLIKKYPEILDEVYLNEEKLKLVTNKILSMDPNMSTVYIAENHGDMIQIFNKYNHDKDVKFIIDNVDAHHDVFYDNEKLVMQDYSNKKVNCANWAGYFDYRKKLLKYNWIRNEHSDVEKFPMKSNYSMTYDLNTIIPNEYNYVFLCKSESWVLPYFDNAWDLLAAKAVTHFENAMVIDAKPIYNRILTQGMTKEFYKKLFTNEG